MNRHEDIGHIGQGFDEFLKEQGRLEDSTNLAVRRIIAFQPTVAMQEQKLTKSALARNLTISRSQLDRLLDPDNMRVTFDALTRAARAVRRELQLDLS